MLVAEKKLAQDEDIGKGECVGYRGMKFEPSAFEEILSSEVWPLENMAFNRESGRNRGHLWVLVDSVSLWRCLSVLRELQYQ